MYLLLHKLKYSLKSKLFEQILLEFFHIIKYYTRPHTLWVLNFILYQQFCWLGNLIMRKRGKKCSIPTMITDTITISQETQWNLHWGCYRSQDKFDHNSTKKINVATSLWNYAMTISFNRVNSIELMYTLRVPVSFY